MATAPQSLQAEFAVQRSLALEELWRRLDGFVDEAICYHESGHIVAFTLLGATVEDVEIVEGGPLERCADTITSGGDDLSAYDLSTAIMAGVVAEQSAPSAGFLGDRDAYAFAQKDVAEIRRLLGDVPAERAWNLLWARAADMLKPNARALTRLAEELRRRRGLDADEIRELTMGLVGK